MDQMLNEESQPEIRRPRRRKRKPGIDLTRYLPKLSGQVEWYYDVRLWLPVFLLLLILALALPGRSTEKEPAETAPIVVETIPEETEPEAQPLNPDAVALARLADSVGAGRSKNVKIIIMWIAINRSEAGGVDGYGLSLQEEIARPNQWQGYDENVVYSQQSYDLALQVLEIQRNGDLRPLDSDMLWLVLNDNGSITVRNRFTATGNQKWREKIVY